MQRPRQFKNLLDWMLQFSRCRSVELRIGMLHALLSIVGEFEKEHLWWHDRGAIVQKLIWAIEKSEFDDKLTSKALQMILSSAYDNVSHTECATGMLVDIIGLLQEVRQRQKQLLLVTTNQALAKQVEKFLEAVARNYIPGTGKITGAIVATICDHKCYALLTAAKWLGHPRVIEHLKSMLANKPLSEIARGPHPAPAWNLAIHLAAAGQFNELVKV